MKILKGAKTMARKMTEEEKAVFAEKMKAARAAKRADKDAESDNEGIGRPDTEQGETAVQKSTEGQTSGQSKDDRVAQLEEMVLRLQKELAERSPQIVQVMGDAEKVVMRFQADVADDNIAVFGQNGMYGQVTGKVGTVIVPKSEWSRFYNESVRRMIENRWLVVLSGMSDDERKLYHCQYREGEVLDENAFARLLDMGRDILAVFPNLCLYYQEMVGRRFAEAWRNGDVRAKDRDLIVALNEISKKSYVDAPGTDPRKRGMFRPIIEEMNAVDAAD